MKRYMIYAWMTLLCGLLFCNKVQAQSVKNLREQALSQMSRLEYSLAVPNWLRLTDVSNPELEDLAHLADCYRLMNRFQDAEIWYARTTAHVQATSLHWMQYGRVLKSNAKYVEAKYAFEQSLRLRGNAKMIQVELAGCDSALLWMEHPTRFEIINEATINTDKAEFGVFPIGEKRVYFVAEPEKQDGRRYGWTGNPFLKLHRADRSQMRLSGKQLVDYPMNQSEMHVGPIHSNRSGTLFFLTRTYPGASVKEQNMEILIYPFVYGEWLNPIPFVHNNPKAYSVGHACLNRNEDVIYFVSNQPGGLGGTDVWYAELQTDGQWGKAMNAGPMVNTPGDEMFPAILPDGSLVFASDGHPGMGGLDLFRSQGSRSKWTRPINLRYPINSPADDFSFLLSQEGQRGYLASNRYGGRGSDDIYSFIERPIPIHFIKVCVLDLETNQPIEEAMVSLENANEVLLARSYTQAAGEVVFRMEPDKSFILHGSKKGYYPDSTQLIRIEPNSPDTMYVNLYLNPLLVKGKTFTLDPILYNFDKYDIRADARIILDELVMTLHENPTLVIELASHTDSRGTDAYNLELSQNRAESVVEYLISRGIARERLKAVGYGERQLLNVCSDGVSCTEEEHQANRRTEFTVLSY